MGRAAEGGGGRERFGGGRDAWRGGSREGRSSSGRRIFGDDEDEEEEEEEEGGTHYAGEGDAEALAGAWSALGTFLKRQCAGAPAYLLSGNVAATAGLRLRAASRVPLTIGGVDCRLLRYDIHASPSPPAAAERERA